MEWVTFNSSVIEKKRRQRGGGEGELCFSDQFMFLAGALVEEVLFKMSIRADGAKLQL